MKETLPMRRKLCQSIAALALCIAALPASASIVNGGFETGALAP
jgi:hypothetical protein